MNIKIFAPLLFFICIAVSSVLAQDGGSNEQTPQLNKSAVKFKELVYNFKTVEFNSDVSHSFIFTNTSNGPVSISRVTPSCGCTTTDYTKGPIMPGKTGSVSIKYDSSREGYFAKTVTVVINEETYTLTFLGTVKPNAYQNTTPQTPQH